MASCKQLSTSIVQGIVIGHCPFHNSISQVKQLAKVCNVEVVKNRVLSRFEMLDAILFYRVISCT